MKPQRESQAFVLVLSTVVLVGGVSLGHHMTSSQAGIGTTLDVHNPDFFAPSDLADAIRGGDSRPGGGKLAAAGWTVSIANKGNASDYPPTVVSGQLYRINVTVVAEVPSGGMGQLTLAFQVLELFGPPRCPGGGLGLPNPESINVTAGLHTFRFNLTSNASVVHRDTQVTGATLVVILAPANGSGSVSDTYPIATTILPVAPALDVSFRADVLAAWAFDFPLEVLVDAVYADPTGVLRQGMNLTVFSDNMSTAVFARDVINVSADFFPGEPGVCIWKPTHGVTWLSTTNHAPALSSPLVNPSEGWEGGNITFSVRYSDADGDPPEVFLLLGGVRLPMHEVSGQYLTGAIFELSMALPLGSNAYSFFADDQSRARNATTTTEVFEVTVRPLALFVTLVITPLAAAVIVIATFVLRRRRRRGKRA